MLLGMLVSSVVYWAGEAIFLGTNPFAALKDASFVPAFDDMAQTTLFKFSFSNIMEIGWFTVITLIITFCIIDMFDTIGTLVGVATKANMLDKDGKVPNIKKALFADAIGTTMGACLGTSTVSTFVESASGVAEGGRTGLTAITTGFMFLLALFFAPIFTSIPTQATAPVLILVGVMMASSLTKIDFDDFTNAIPAFLTFAMMPLAYNIADGIIFGIISFTVLKLATNKKSEVNLSLILLSILFILKFVLQL